MFDESFISNVTNYVDNFNSHAIPVTGNTLVLQVTLHESSGLGAAEKLTLSMETSYDGRVWKSVFDSGMAVEFTADGLQEKDGTRVEGVDWAYVRVRATLSGSGTKTAIFSATVVCSSLA